MPPKNGTASESAESTPTSQKVEKWAAIAGKWRFNRGNAKYLGPDQGQGASSPLGLAIASLRFRDGELATQIKLSRNDRSSAGLVFGYQSPNARYVGAQIGGFGRAYSIADFQPEVGWVTRSAAGSLSNLTVEQPHSLVVRVTGQTVEMEVDEVSVLRQVLSQPIEGSGFGLFAWDDAEIEFSGTTVLALEPRVFVIMPFKEPFDTLYRDVIDPVTKEAGFAVVRVDEIHGPGIILNDIQQQIEKAHAVVAEISTHNPNVFYELGYAHALRKPAILLVRRQEGTPLPFDVQGYRAIFYDDNIGGKKTVERNLRQHLDAISRDS